MPKKGPQPIGDVLAQIMARQGLGRQLADEQLQHAWRAAVGEAFHAHTRLGRSRRGVLEVLVDNSTFVQELTFRKSDILKTLREHAPELDVRDLRFRVGPVHET